MRGLSMVMAGEAATVCSPIDMGVVVGTGWPSLGGSHIYTA